MPRRPRIHYPGAAYHAMARGVDGRSIFEVDADRLSFMDSLHRAAVEAKASVIAHCLMGNHFHLLIRIHRVPLSAILHKVLSRYAFSFNMRHGRTGHLFQARYKANVVLDERYLLRLVSYIHQNPVRAGLVPTAADWPWSSAGSRSLAAPDAILEHVDDAGEEDGFDPWSPAEGLDTSLIGVSAPSESLAAPFDECLKVAGCDDRFVRSRRRDYAHTAARRRFVHAALKRGISATAIARWLGVHRAAVHHLAKAEFLNELAA